jgi:hypothetical protein
MTAATISAAEAADTDVTEVRLGWQARRRQARELRLRDQTSARLAELDHIACILNEAADLVCVGWVQDSWFAYRDDAGHIRLVNAYNAKELGGRTVVGACVVGAIVQAGGGLPQLRSQVVLRAVDLTWHTLFNTPTDLVRRTPAPEIRMRHVQDLTQWNDHPRRTAREAEELLRRSASAAKSEAEMRLRAIDQERLVPR